MKEYDDLRERHLASLLDSIKHRILSEEIKPKYIMDDSTLAALCFTISCPCNNNKEYVEELIDSAIDILREPGFFDHIEYTDICEDENSNNIYTHVTLFYGTKIFAITPYEI